MRLAHRIHTPWWYRLGAAACTASVFVGAGLALGRPGTGSATGSMPTLLVLVGAVLAPAVLLWALRRSTGVSVERYAEGTGPWTVAVVALFALGVALQTVAGVPALLVAAAGAVVATLVREHHLDGRLRRRVRSAPDGQDGQDGRAAG